MNPEFQITINDKKFNLHPGNTHINIVKKNYLLDHILHVDNGEDKSTYYRLYRELFECSGHDYDEMVRIMNYAGYMVVLLVDIPQEVEDMYVRAATESMESELLNLE